jgi:Subtilase family
MKGPWSQSAASADDATDTVPTISTEAPADDYMLANPAPGSLGAPAAHPGSGSDGASAAQVRQALDESGLSDTGAGIKVGVLSDSFNDLGGAAADEADGALPPASDIQVLKDLPSGGTDEGRAMMQIIHDIAPGASLAFYTAAEGEQSFAQGILALAADGCKVIVDDVSYLDEPFFQNGVVAQAIQTVEAEGVTVVTAAGNNASNAYQAAFTPISGMFDGTNLQDAESFSGSPVQTITVGGNASENIPLVLQWNQAYGHATSDLEMLVFRNGHLISEATNASSGEPANPIVEFNLTEPGTYQVSIENQSGPNPGLIKEIAEGDGLPAMISGANTGSIFGHEMTPGAITAGAVDAADTPAFGVQDPMNEPFSSSGAGSELLFGESGTPLATPDLLSPVVASGVDDIHTSLSGGLSDFFGTSAAAASLAGAAALLLAENPDLTPAQVSLIMRGTALPTGNTAVGGAGLVQVDPAAAAATDIAAHGTPSSAESHVTTAIPNLVDGAVGTGTMATGTEPVTLANEAAAFLTDLTNFAAGHGSVATVNADLQTLLQAAGIANGAAAATAHAAAASTPAAAASAYELTATEPSSAPMEAYLSHVHLHTFG